MSPLKATCRDCDTVMVGRDIPEIGDLMIQHHREARTYGNNWTSAACGICWVNRTDAEGKIIPDKGRWLETTANLVVVPFVGRVVYDPARDRIRLRGKERE